MSSTKAHAFSMTFSTDPADRGGFLLKFIELRTHEGAQWEIQKVAEACLDIVEDLWPVAVSSYRKVKNEKDSVS